MVVNAIGRGLKMKTFAASAALIILGAVSATSVSAADMDAMATKAPPYAVAPAASGAESRAAALRGVFRDRLPIALVRRTALRHGGPGRHCTRPTARHSIRTSRAGASYLWVLAVRARPTGRPDWGLGPNALSQSVIGVEIKEPIAPAVGPSSAVDELAYDPYSALLANAPASLDRTPRARRRTRKPYRYDSSRWGWLGTQNQYVGVNSATFGAR